MTEGCISCCIRRSTAVKIPCAPPVSVLVLGECFTFRVMGSTSSKTNSLCKNLCMGICVAGRKGVGVFEAQSVLFLSLLANDMSHATGKRSHGACTSVKGFSKCL